MKRILSLLISLMMMFAFVACNNTEDLDNSGGGQIKKKVVIKEEYACEKCGKRATAKEKFCSDCGGEIKVKEKPPVAEPTEAEASAEAESSATLDEEIPQG